MTTDDAWFHALKLADSEARLERMIRKNAPDAFIAKERQILSDRKKRLVELGVTGELIAEARKRVAEEDFREDMFAASAVGKLTGEIEKLIFEHPNAQVEGVEFSYGWDDSIETLRKGVKESSTWKILTGIDGLLTQVRKELTQ